MPKTRKKTKTPAKKTKKKTTKVQKVMIVVISLGDIRDTEWETTAELGLGLLKKMREAGFTPSTEAPYISDGGDVPLVITVTMEQSPYILKKSVDLLNFIVGDDSRVNVNVFTEKEWDKYRNDG